MVKRVKQEDMAGVLEFAGRSSNDAEFKEWMEDHKAGNGGKVRVSLGGKGVRVMFSKAADMTVWKQRAEKADKVKAAGR